MGTGVTKPVWPSRKYAVWKVFKVYYVLEIMKINSEKAKEQIENFFSSIEYKSPEQVRKMKKLAMAYNLKLKNKRKLFCQKCYSTRLRVLGIKNKIKRVKCEGCGRIIRWRVK